MHFSREGTWKLPPIFDFLRKTGDVPRDEMYRVFNMGIGMVIVVARAQVLPVLKTLSRLGEKPSVVGQVVRGAGEVSILPS